MAFEGRRTGIESGTQTIDLLEQITMIRPMDTPFMSMAPKVSAKGTYHEWITDVLTPIVERRVGWGVFRTVYGWFLSLKKKVVKS